MKQFIELLFSSQIQAHVYHLQISNNAKHVALQGYYEGIQDLIDQVAENYQGKYDIIDFGFKTTIKGLQSDEDATLYFEKLLKYVEGKRKELPQDEMLTAVYDEIQGLVSSTLYKLKHLS